MAVAVLRARLPVHAVFISELVRALVGGQSIGAGIPFEYSEQDDISNQEKAMTYFEPKYYNDENKWSLNEESLQEAFSLAQKAFTMPALALPIAQVLYLYGWYRRSREATQKGLVNRHRFQLHRQHTYIINTTSFYVSCLMSDSREWTLEF